MYNLFSSAHTSRWRRIRWWLIRKSWWTRIRGRWSVNVASFLSHFGSIKSFNEVREWIIRNKTFFFLLEQLFTVYDAYFQAAFDSSRINRWLRISVKFRQLNRILTNLAFHIYLAIFQDSSKILFTTMLKSKTKLIHNVKIGNFKTITLIPLDQRRVELLKI